MATSKTSTLTLEQVRAVLLRTLQEGEKTLKLPVSHVVKRNCKCSYPTHGETFVEIDPNDITMIATDAVRKKQNVRMLFCQNGHIGELLAAEKKEADAFLRWATKMTLAPLSQKIPFPTGVTFYHASNVTFNQNKGFHHA